MSFSIILQTNYSELNKVDKDVSDILEATGDLRDESSILNPSILVQCSLESLVDCNYMTIASFGRSYFVTDITSVRKNLVRIDGHVDVLSSFAAEIRNNVGIISKQEWDWNLYLNDGTFHTYQNPIVLTKAFPSGFTTQEFVLAIAGA